MSRNLPDDLLLPPRARLFHIGPPKTASTTLQAAAADHREQLLAHGVRYPGPRRSHRHEIAAFVGRPIGWVGAPGSNPAPAMAKWDALMAEIGADHERRILMGHEYAAGADDAMAARFVEAIGERIHVVITLRDYASMLPSIWQEYNKAGNTGVFDQWLQRVLARPRPQEVVDRVHVRHDQGMLVRRWAAAAGPENVTVVVLDPADHGTTTRTPLTGQSGHRCRRIRWATNRSSRSPVRNTSARMDAGRPSGAAPVPRFPLAASASSRVMRSGRACRPGSPRWRVSGR